MIAPFFRRNVGLKALSLTLAVLAWAYLTYGANPVVRAGITQQLEVPVSVRNVRPGMIAEPVQQTVTAVVSGDRGLFDEPSAKEFVAVVDLRGVGPGTYSVVPRIVAPKEVDVQRVRPASIVVTVDRLASRRFPIFVQYRGKPAQVSSGAGANVAPTTVVVRGAANSIGRIAAVAAEVPADRLSVGFNALLAPVAIDVKGRPIGDVVIAPNLVRVTVETLSSNK